MTTAHIKIGNKLIGEGEPTFIITEAGSNHNGSLEQAKKLIDVAAKSGADAVKFQIFQAENLYSKYTPEFRYLKGKNTFDFEAVDLLDKHVPAFKIASFEITDLELIKYVAEKGKPMIISTGMANLGEIEDAINVIKSVGNEDIILLHCNSLYPTPVEVVNLRAIETMKTSFKVPVGFSDHTVGIQIPIAAVAMGACVIEKHFTLDRTLPGPDHSFAIEPDELKEMVRGIREVEKAKGTKITRDMLVIKRPGYGINPKFIDIVVGKETKKDIKEDEWIT